MCAARAASGCPPFGVDKVIARRVAQELRLGWAVNLGFGISANVPRILLEEGRHGDVTWVIEQGAVGGVPLLDFQFGCSANAEAIMPSPQQFTYFQGGGFDCSLLSFLQIDRDGNVNVSQARGQAACDGRLRRLRRHHHPGEADRVQRLLHRRREARRRGRPPADRGRRQGQEARSRRSSTSRSAAGGRVAQGQEVTYVTERCVMRLTPDGSWSPRSPRASISSATCWRRRRSRSQVAPDLRTMDAAVFRPEPFGLVLPMTAGSVRIEIEGAVATVTLDRAEKLNALTTVMLEQLEAAAARLEREAAVQVVLLTGEGEKAFCAGADIADWGALDPLDIRPALGLGGPSRSSTGWPGCASR